MQRTVAHFSTAATGDVVEAVKSAKLTSGQGNCLNSGLRIDGISTDSPAGIAQFALSRSHAFCFAPYDDHFGAGLDERASGRKAKTCGAAHHDDRFSIEAKASH